MANGAKKLLLRCTKCNVAYNVTNLKPGTKFKCQKCQTINVVPQKQAPAAAAPPPPKPAPKPKPPAAPAPPPPPSKPAEEFTEDLPDDLSGNDDVDVGAGTEIEEQEEAPPPQEKTRVKPKSKLGVTRTKLKAAKPGKPKLPGKKGLSKTGKFAKGKLGAAGKSSKLGKFKKPSARKGKTGDDEEDDMEIAEPKKSKKLLIIIVVVCVVIIGLVVFLMMGSSKPIDDDFEDDEIEEEENGDEEDKPKRTSRPRKDKPKLKRDWVKASSDAKEDVRKMYFEGIKDSTKTKAEVAKAIKDVIDIYGEEVIVAMIDLVMDDPEGPDASGLIQQIGEFTKIDPLSFKSLKAYKPKAPNSKVMENFKLFWLNKEQKEGYVFPPEKLLKELDEMMAADTGPAPPEMTVRNDFKELVDESLRPKVHEIVQLSSDGEMGQDEAIEKLKAMGKAKVVPILITEIGLDDEGFVGLEAADILKQITGWKQAPEYRGGLAIDQRFDICRDWQKWWMDNKDK